MEKSTFNQHSASVSKLKKLRYVLLTLWTLFGIAILFLIQYADVHVDLQKGVTMAVRVFGIASCVMAGFQAYLTTKIHALRENKS